MGHIEYPWHYGKLLKDRIKPNALLHKPWLLIGSMERYRRAVLETTWNFEKKYFFVEVMQERNIAKIIFLGSDKNVVFVLGVRFTFLFDSKNSWAQE